MPDTTTPASPKATNPAKKAVRPRRASSAGASKARTTAARSRGASKSKPAAARTSSTRSTTDLVGDYAERAVLIPVGAALLARERVVSSVTDAISTYSSPSKTQSQLRKFEHRGSAARTRMEREVRKTRTRLERELRERRRELDKRRERLTKEVTSRVEQTQSQIEKTQSQIEDALRARLEEGADLASRVQERVLSLV
jgi:C4-dicarboxylate-specific signal transduction histidine kinase